MCVYTKVRFVRIVTKLSLENSIPLQSDMHDKAPFAILLLAILVTAFPAAAHGRRRALLCLRTYVYCHHIGYTSWRCV